MRKAQLPCEVEYPDLKTRKEYFNKWQQWFHPYTCCDHVSMVCTNSKHGEIICPKCGRAQALPMYSPEQQKFIDKHIKFCQLMMNKFQ